MWASFSENVCEQFLLLWVCINRNNIWYSQVNEVRLYAQQTYHQQCAWLICFEENQFWRNGSEIWNPKLFNRITNIGEWGHSECVRTQLQSSGLGALEVRTTRINWCSILSVNLQRAICMMLFSPPQGCSISPGLINHAVYCSDMLNKIPVRSIVEYRCAEYQ